MIVVCVTQSRITVDGHAGYAENGKDIVCAAVSILVQSFVGSIESLTNEKIQYEMQPGHMDIVFENLSEQGSLLVDSLFIGLCAVANAYGSDYVQIK